MIATMKHLKIRCAAGQMFINKVKHSIQFARKENIFLILTRLSQVGHY